MSMQYFFFHHASAEYNAQIVEKTISTKLTIYYFIHDNPSNRFPHSQDKVQTVKNPIIKKHHGEIEQPPRPVSVMPKGCGKKKRSIPGS